MQIKKLTLILLLVPVSILAQDVSQLENNLNIKSLELMSDEDLKDIKDDALNKGYSINQFKIIARAQGVSERNRSLKKN